MHEPLHSRSNTHDYQGSITSVVNSANASKSLQTSDKHTMNTVHQLGDLQLAIMRVLWSIEEATVAEVHQSLQAERGLALTTIATMLSKMEKKGVVKHRTEGRQFIYAPAVSEEAVTRNMVSEFTERLFRGDPTALVNHLLTAGEIDSKELEAIRQLVDQHSDGAGQ
ncbi:MAG: BlaI family penicillinase repressor [Planctomycetota bacterium]|jgi:BlaI family penicillinase repressor